MANNITKHLRKTRVDEKGFKLCLSTKRGLRMPREHVKAFLKNDDDDDDNDDDDDGDGVWQNRQQWVGPSKLVHPWPWPP
jgi:hypothetical protein